MPTLNVRTDLRHLIGAKIQSFNVRDGEQALGDLGQLVLGKVNIFQVDQALQVDGDVGQVALGVAHVQGA